MKHNLKRRSDGFTIIEVVIVLAVAALIMLIVFMAVPALQRNQRNNAKKSESGRIAAAVVEYTSNNQGSLPTDTTKCANLLKAVGELSQYKAFNNTCTQANTVGGGTVDSTFYLVPAYLNSGTDAQASATVPHNSMIMVNGASCKTGSSDTVTGQGTASTQVALLYSYEQGATWAWTCVNPQ